MDKRTLIYTGLVFGVVQSIVNLGIFVTFPQMAAYAVSKDQFSMVRDDVKEIKQDQKEILKSQTLIIQEMAER